jgi:SurA-like N-terminal domain
VSTSKAEMEISVAEVVDHMRLTGAFAPALTQVVQRKCTAEAARKQGIKVSTEELQKAADVFRIDQGLFKASDTEAWLASQGLSTEALEEWLETNVLIYKFKNHLERKSNQKRYLSSDSVKSTVRELVYQDWLRKAMNH